MAASLNVRDPYVPPGKTKYDHPVGNMPVLYGDYGAPVGLGIRIIVNEEGKIDLYDEDTGKPLVRADEVEELKKAHQKEVRARRKAEKACQLAEQRIRELEAENERLKNAQRPHKNGK